MHMRHVLTYDMHIIIWVKHGVGKEALALIYQMNKMGIKHNHSIFTSAFLVCINMTSIEHSAEVHEEILRQGFIMICL